MSDRYRGYAPSGRSATFNPARTSLPSSIGYTSLYAGDINVLPASRHHTTTPRGYTASSASSAVPTTTRTYAVTQDPRSMRPTTRDISRHRSSTLDSAARPPVIVMTTQGKDRPHAGSSQSSNLRSSSPIRDDYRSSGGDFYTQPASSIRSRSSARPFADQLDADEYTRLRERSDSLLRDDPYRGSRHSVIYPHHSRHGSSVVDYGDEGYQYTNAGELARYDLDNSSASTSRPRRRESVDRGYYRPNITYNADPRSSNPDGSYNMNTSRVYDSRTGPPTTTRGYDRLPREYYEPARDVPRDVPPAAPAPPEPPVVVAPHVVTPQTEVVSSTTDGRRARPVSLYQEGPVRSNHYDDYYRSREDERNMRELRDREQESERAYDAAYFQDNSVTTRGFGIRTEQPAEELDDRRERRREYRAEEPKKRSDEELLRDPEPEREERRRRRESKDGRRERRESKRGSDDDEKERSRFRDKMAAGLGIAATAMGLAPPAAKDDDRREREKESRRRRGSDEDREKRKDSDDYERPKVSDRSRSRHRDHDRRDSKDESEPKDRKRRNPESRKNGEAANSSSESDEVKKTARRHRASTAFDPNDTSDLKQLREQLATMKTDDKEIEKEKVAAVDTTRTRSASPVKNAPIKPILKDSPPPPQDEIRGRDLIIPTLEEREKQVRVVSPPREKKEDKPIKGILKQPKVSFPEEPNPIREGVAPHKEDKKMKDTPPGAKWTKISRKIVNPEALSIGKERYEIRDDFVIVLRVLSKEEIQTYAAATQVLRERRRRNEEGDRDPEDRDRDEEEKRRHHRRHRHRDDDEDDRDDKDRDRERRRRHRDDDDHHHHHRSQRDRDAVEA